MKNPIFKKVAPQSAKGYSSFPLDQLVNMTSVCGYLIPVYWTWLNPGDKVTMSSLLRTRTQPFAKPAMGTIIERVEWFAVPLEQLYKGFSAQFYGIDDLSSDFMSSSSFTGSNLPFISGSSLATCLNGLPTTFNSQSAVPVSVPTLSESCRLLDAFGLDVRTLDNVENRALPFSISALPLAAYQKIYSDHYRLTDREVNDVQSYNLDSFYSNPGISETNRLRKLLTLRKRPYSLDYFTSMQVSPLMGNSSVNSVSNVSLGQVNNWLTGLSQIRGVTGFQRETINGGTAAANVAPSDVALTGTSDLSANDLRSAITPSNIRSLFAVEKLLEVTRRAKKHYDMQTLAHFGVDVPKGLSGECFKIGTHEQFINIGEVVSTAETSDGSLGERAGLGSSNSKSERFRFEAMSHCVLMAIYSAEPVMNYTNDGVSRELTKTNAVDFYKSEFDSLGMQPVFGRELRLVQSDEADVVASSSVLGWQYRYAEYKSKYNRSFGGVGRSYFSEWAFNKTPISSALSRNFFFVWPTDLNAQLLVSYTGDGTKETVFNKDYFINQFYFDVVKSSKMSVYGQPNL